MSQEQVANAFGYKWTHHKDWGMSGATADITTAWLTDLMGFNSDQEYADYFSSKKSILDAGCGNGRETRRLATLAPNSHITAIDISDARLVAGEHTKSLKNVTVLQGDVSNPPFPPHTFDCIVALGVLHHTPSTKAALAALAKILKPDGEILFTIYRKKAPMREFADDHIRAIIQHMTPEDAWAEMEGITQLGKALWDLKAEIELPTIRTLGIEEGRHNVQRLIYYTMLKCYWREDFSFQENVHVNFDWYYPAFSWRNTKEEVREWFKEIGLVEVFFKEIPATLSFRAKAVA